MKIMALDIATATGWAVGTPDGLPRVGTFRCPKSFDEEAFGKRWAAFQEWCGGMLDLERPDILAFEAPIVAGKVKSSHNTTRLLFGLATIAETVAASRNVECNDAHIQTVRKHFTGHGFASKDEVVVACMNRGVMVANHNEADAVAVLSYLQHGYRCTAAWATEIPKRGTLPPLSDRAALRKAGGR